MEELLQKMNQYWEKHEATYEDGGLMFFDDSEPDCETGEVVNLMWEHLFIESGFNYKTVDYLRANGYSIRVFERDSWGILIAGVGKDRKWFSIG